ncbi:MAG TPA: hypothetical protein VGT41_04545 [Candidatus Babeliales bacterium]|nr:hypothetical protein [Candidatus Babeliales bacterium]
MLKKMLMASLVSVMALSSSSSFAGWRNGEKAGCGPCAKPVTTCEKFYEPQPDKCHEVCKKQPPVYREVCVPQPDKCHTVCDKQPDIYETVCVKQPDICTEKCTTVTEKTRRCKTPCKKTCPKPCAKKRCDTTRRNRD